MTPVYPQCQCTVLAAADACGNRPSAAPRLCRQIFEGCGEPKLRRRRQAGGDAPSYDAPTDFKKVKLQTYPDGGMEAEPSPLLRVLGQIRSRVSSCPPPSRNAVLSWGTATEIQLHVPSDIDGVRLWTMVLVVSDCGSWYRWCPTVDHGTGV